ncbi:hypothetical protein O0L34_g12464 [Tuta absoluta]|nr:hypothetical protein O0L34_g12464 [Tuta absoluta]
MIELKNALEKVKWDIIGLSEIRREGNIIEEHDWCIFNYFGEKKGENGVGFIVRKEHKENISEFKGISDRVALLNIKIHDTPLSIIQVYAPTQTASKEELEKFYSDIQIARQSATENLVILGDFNAKIGKSTEKIGSIIGPYGSGTCNERGEILKLFALEEELTIINSIFKKKENQRWTWMSPDGVTKNEIDYILTNRSHFFINCEIIRKIPYPSDHRLLRGTLSLSKKKKSRKSFSKPMSTLQSDKEQIKYRKSLDAKLIQHTRGELSMQNLYNATERAIQESLSEAKIINRQKKFKISSITKEMIARRHNLQQKLNKSQEEKDELKLLYKNIKLQIQDEYDTYKLKKYEHCIEKTGGVKRAHKKLKDCTSWIPKLKTSQGSTGKRQELILVATDFYRKLYESNTTLKANTNDTILSPNPKTSNEVEEFTMKEIETAIKRLNNNKSPGPDLITNESLKVGLDILVGLLRDIFNKVLKEQRVPSQWTESEITLLYKKGDPSDVSNYRPISLMSSLYKLFSQCILARIGPKIDSKQPTEQAGFRPGYSTTDHIQVLCQVIEKYKEFNRPLYLAFIDYRKAFDSISHNSIKEALEYHEIEETYINIIMNIYEDCSSRVRLDRVGPTFKIGRGVRQGDPLSPKIFIAVLEFILKKINWSHTGIRINSTYLNHLCFADDIVLFSENAQELENTLQSLHKASKEIGLEINFEKTKIMTNHTKTLIKVEEDSIEYVDEYIYLGKLVSFDDTDKKEIDRRITTAWNRYWSLKHIFKSKITARVKGRLMDTCILPTLTYACQTWSLTEKNANKISVCQRAMERSLLRLKLKDKKRNETIRQKTKVKDAIVHVRRLKWKWAGHLTRYKDGRWTKKVTEWTGPVQGKRRPGRPLKRWADDIRATAGAHWTRLALDREKWNQLEEAFTRMGVPKDNGIEAC